MARCTWLITGVSSGFGRELIEQILVLGDRVVGTVRQPAAVADLVERYPDAFRVEILDVTDRRAIREVVDHSFTELRRVDVLVSNAGSGLFARPRNCRTRRSSTSLRRTSSGRST